MTSTVEAPVTEDNQNVAETSNEAVKAGEQPPKPRKRSKTKPEAKKGEQTTEAKSPKGSKGSKPRSGLLTLHQATQQALKTGGPAETNHIFVLPIAAITKYDNPRHEPESLYEQGYILFGDPKVEVATETEFVSLVHMALSDDMKFVRHFVNLIEEFEGPTKRLKNAEGRVMLTASEADCKKRLKKEDDHRGWKIEDHPGAPQSILQLAEDIAAFSQLDPIEVRKHGQHYHGVDGGRRIAAILYLHAKSRVLREDNQEDKNLFGEGVPSIYPPTVLATDLKASGDDFLISVVMNLSRKAFSPLQQGRVFHEMLKKTNSETGKNYTMKEAAAALGVEYGTFRNREALWKDPEFENKDGKRVHVRGLTDEDRRKVAMGEITLTAASRKALGEKHYSPTGSPVGRRNRGIPLAEMQRRFDETAEANIERRRALAECMGFEGDKGFEKACRESDARIAEQERVDMEGRGKGKRGKGQAA